MSTNFYMVPKEQKDIENKLYLLRNNYNEKLVKIIEDYKLAVKNEILKLTDNNNLKSIISYDDSETFLDNMSLPYLWEYELPRLHIGKRSGGWKFLFQENKYWKTFDGIKAFYDKNKDNLEILDEYDRVYTWQQFHDEVKETYEKPDNISHIEYAKQHDYYGFNNSYSIDVKYGYEFDSREFS